jgi:glycosyltransferase involved in cell wall biosynthesis
MDVYAHGLVTGLKAIRPEWEIIELTPNHLDRKSRSWASGFSTYYERYWHYPRTVAKQKADIFHIIDHSYGHLAYFLKKTGKPVIVTCHDLVHFIYPENLYMQARLPPISMAAWKFAVRGMRWTNHIVTVSSNTAKDVVQILNTELERITVVPNAVNSIFRPLIPQKVEFFRQQNRVSVETFCLLNVGGDDPRKNIFTILRVLENLKHRGLLVHLWKAGSEFTDDEKIFLRTHSLENSVTYLGQLDNQTLVQTYNAADVLLAPSLYEGFGMTILEAMACGTPVITSNVSSLPEVAGDAAILVDPMDVQAIVKAVCRLQNDSVYRHGLIDKGIKRAQSFTWETTVEQVAKVYEKVILNSLLAD